MAPRSRAAYAPRGRRARAPPAEPSITQELLETAFHRASLANPHGSSKPERDRRRAQLKVVRASATVGRHLRLEVRDLRPPAVGEFEQELLDRAFGPGTRERSLARLRRAEERIRRTATEAEREVARAAGSEELGVLVRRFYGRLASFVREVEPDLARARAMRRFLKERPRLEAGAPRLVVAGFPNVGKSSLVARLSSARPKVAPYPFTTVAIAVGHADLGFDRLQVVDTPGMLGRSGRANLAETEAELAVSRAATVVLFVLDPSGSSGYPIEEQERLLARWREEFPELPIVAVETKADLARRPGATLAVSAKTGEGLEELWGEIRQRFVPRGELPPMEIATVEEEPPASSLPAPRRSSRARSPRAPREPAA